MTKNNITCFRDYYKLKIYINEILHLTLNMEDFVGMQSWYEGSGKHKNFFIEYCFKEGEPILTGYDLKQNWVDILKLMDENI